MNHYKILLAFDIYRVPCILPSKLLDGSYCHLFSSPRIRICHLWIHRMECVLCTYPDSPLSDPEVIVWCIYLHLRIEHRTVVAIIIKFITMKNYLIFFLKIIFLLSKRNIMFWPTWKCSNSENSGYSNFILFEKKIINVFIYWTNFFFFDIFLFNKKRIFFKIITLDTMNSSSLVTLPDEIHSFSTFPMMLSFM